MQTLFTTGRADYLRGSQKGPHKAEGGPAQPKRVPTTGPGTTRGARQTKWKKFSLSNSNIYNVTQRRSDGNTRKVKREQFGLASDDERARNF